MTYFLRVARLEICGYLIVKIYTNFGVRIESYRSNVDYAHVSTVPDKVPYPIEPTRSVLGRPTIGFHIGPREPDAKLT